jgi:putative ABC transport system permease protein
MDTFFTDLRYAARKLLKTPGFTLITALTLALAIGANTVIFSIINGIVLRPLPFRAPERLVRVTTTSGGGNNPSSVNDFLDYRTQSKRVAQMAAVDGSTVNLTGVAEPMRLQVLRTSGNFWSLLGVSPTVGRGYTPDEDREGAPRVVVLGAAFWRNQFGADRGVIGKSVTLDGNPYTVIGVAPEGFAYPDERDAYVPLVFAGDDLNPDNRGAHWLGVIGRLADGATVEQATQELGTIAKRLEAQYPRSNTGFGAKAVPLREYMVGDVRPALLVLLGAVGFVLLIACANVANLLLVRASSRETEMAVRAALGAGRSQIARQLVTESVVLALVGGALGLVLAVWGVDLLVALSPVNLPRLHEVRIDGRVLGFTAAVAIGTGLLFGLLPAVQASRPNITGMLKEGGRGGGVRRGTQRLRSTLVVSEMALAVVLLVGAGLLIKNFMRLLAVDPGFRTEQVVTFNVTIPDAKYERVPELRAFVAELVDRMRRLPGAKSSAAVLGLPMGGQTIRTVVNIVGQPEDPPERRKLIDVAVATPNYLTTMGIPLQRGRDFADQDRREAPQVVLINETAAKRYFPNEDPVGKKITIGWTETDSTMPNNERVMGGEIVGIVGNVHREGLNAEPNPEVYLPFDQTPVRDLAIVVRSSAEPDAVAAAVKAQLRALDPDIPPYRLRRLGELVSESVSRPRFYMLLLGGFSGVALALAALGIYGVISYAVSQRTRELGIRIALGATRDQVTRLVLGQGLALSLTGLLVGLGAAFYLTRVMASLLFGIDAIDPPTFAAVAVVLLGVAGLASYLPARRAAHVDPMVAIRTE